MFSGSANWYHSHLLWTRKGGSLNGEDQTYGADEQEYEAPQIVVLGDLASLTQGPGGGPNDNPSQNS